MCVIPCAASRAGTMDRNGAMQGKVAVVTGGSGGIGSAICRRLASEGARVVLTFNRNEEAAHQLLHALPGEGHRAARVSVDDSSTLERLAGDVTERYGREKAMRAEVTALKTKGHSSPPRTSLTGSSNLSGRDQ